MDKVVSYKCPNCGGGLKFSPGKGFKCEYCLSQFTQEQLDAIAAAQQTEKPENQSAAGQAQPEQSAPAQGTSSQQVSDAKPGEAVVYSCPSCGAQVMTDATTAATSCHYCHNPIVLSGKLSGEYKPDMIIPFVLTKEQAAEQFRKHCEGKTFLPKDFYSEEQIEHLYGVYYPYWVVSSEISGSYTARGEVEKITRMGDDRHIDITSYNVERGGNISLRDITGSALKSEDAELLKYVLPFELAKGVDFSMAYLSGFRAEMRNLEQKDVKPQVEQTKRELTQQLLKQTVGGYSSLSSEKTLVNTRSEEWRYALLPLWIVTYKYADRIYMYGINGQTGKAFGELPVDTNKLAGASIGVGIIAALIVFFIFMMMGGAGA